MKLDVSIDAVLLFVLQWIVGLSALGFVLFTATSFQLLTTFIMAYLMMMFGSTIGYHRLLSHKAFKSPKWFEYLCVYFGTTLMFGSVIQWVAWHREHHRYADTDKDPHAPKFKGYIYSHFLHMFYAIKPKYAADLMRSKFYQFQHKHFFKLITVYGLLLYLIDPFAVLYLWLAPVGICKILLPLSLSYSHRNGKAHDDVIAGIITAGECFHKTHHDDPSKVLMHPLDISGHVINLVKQ